MRARFANILFFGIGLFIGLIASKCFISYSLITFDPTFSFGNVIAAVTTLLVGGLLAFYFQKQTASDRREKELLLRQLDFILDELIAFERFTEGGVLTEITACLHRLSTKRTAIEKVLVELEYPAEIVEGVKFKDAISEVRKLATKTPSIKQLSQHANSKKCNSVVREGIIEIAAEKTALLDNRIQDLKTEVIKIQLKINRI